MASTYEGPKWEEPGDGHIEINPSWDCDMTWFLGVEINSSLQEWMQLRSVAPLLKTGSEIEAILRGSLGDAFDQNKPETWYLLLK